MPSSRSRARRPDDALGARADLRLLGPAAASWGAVLLVAQMPTPVGCRCAVGLLVLSAVAAVLGTRQALRPWRGAALALALACACAGAASLAAAVRLEPLESGPVVALARSGAVGEADLVLTSDPVRVASRVVGNARAPTQYVARGDVVELRAHGRSVRGTVPVLVVGSGGTWKGLLPGQRVRVGVRLRPADPRSGDDVAAVLSARGPPTLVGAPPLVQRWAGALRGRLRESVRGLAPAERGLVPGLVDGDTSALPDATAQDFRTAGLTHLVAVSGDTANFAGDCYTSPLGGEAWTAKRSRATSSTCVPPALRPGPCGCEPAT